MSRIFRNPVLASENLTASNILHRIFSIYIENKINNKLKQKHIIRFGYWIFFLLFVACFVLRYFENRKIENIVIGELVSFSDSMSPLTVDKPSHPANIEWKYVYIHGLGVVVYWRAYRISAKSPLRLYTVLGELCGGCALVVLLCKASLAGHANSTPQI